MRESSLAESTRALGLALQRGGGCWCTQGAKACASGLRGHTTQAEQSPLNVVYWNVAGVKASDIDTFLEQRDADLSWDVIVLRECSHARLGICLSGVRRAGHLVSA